MIEVNAVNCTNLKEGVAMLSRLFTWLTNILAKDETISIEGHIVFSDMKTRASGILICDNIENQKRIMQILKQPPGEFEGRYQARMTNEEPILVEETEETEETEEKVRKTPIDVS